MSHGRNCSVPGCTGDGDPSHSLPKEPDTRRAWLMFLYKKIPVKFDSQLFICSKHFTKDSFENLGQFKAGYAKLLFLKRGTVPTVWSSPPQASTSQERQHAACQTDAPSVASRGTQLSLMTLRPHLRSKGIQATVLCQSGAVGTTAPPVSGPLSSSPLKGLRPAKRPRLECEEEEELEEVSYAGTDPQSVTTETESSQLSTSPVSSYDAKYIVFEQCLLSLFETCPVCTRVCNVVPRRRGSFLAVDQLCPHCQFFRQWKSQPVIGSTPVGNLQRSAAIYFCGVSFSKLKKMFEAMQLITRTYAAFRRHARTYLEPSIIHSRTERQTQKLKILSEANGVVLGGDMRADSPGHSAKYGSYTMMDVQTNEIADIQLVQSSEVGGSSYMEEEGLIRTLDLLHGSGVKLDCSLTDRHPQIPKSLREPKITHPYDVWHVAKDLPPDVLEVIIGEEEQQELVVKEEVPPEQQECSSSVDQQEPEPLPHIKEEQEELWSSQEGEQLQGLEEADITKFPFTPVPVKSEDDEEEAQSSQLHQRQTQHMETEADGEDCGGPETARNSHPLLQPETEDQTGDSSETDDSDWSPANEASSGLASVAAQKHGEAAESDAGSPAKERPFPCSYCGKRFSLKGNLNRHIRDHTGERPFPCTGCDKSFKDSGSLTAHMRCHTGEQPYSCLFCGKNFSGRGNMTRHMRIHTGEKPFSCSLCSKSFHVKEHLSRHIKYHTGEKPFSCSVCGKGCAQKTDLKKHMRVHTGEKPFSCPFCGKCCAEKGDLTKHMRVHTGEKPFSCNVCGKSCAQKGSLKIHMRVHTGEKPFSCSVCSKRFTVTGHLKRHMKLHAGDANAAEDAGSPSDSLQEVEASDTTQEVEASDTQQEVEALDAS